MAESNTGKGCSLPPWLTEGLWRSLGSPSSSIMVITEDHKNDEDGEEDEDNLRMMRIMQMMRMIMILKLRLIIGC